MPSSRRVGRGSLLRLGGGWKGLLQCKGFDNVIAGEKEVKEGINLLSFLKFSLL